ncbi:MAG: hypothetical protein WCI85_05595 [Comamonadaceae bacterium]
MKCSLVDASLLASTGNAVASILNDALIRVADQFTLTFQHFDAIGTRQNYDTRNVVIHVVPTASLEDFSQVRLVNSDE